MESPTSRRQYDQLSSHVAGEASASLRPHSQINYSEALGEDIGDGEDISDLNVDPHFNIEVDDDDIIKAPEEDLFAEYVPNPFYTDVNIAGARAIGDVLGVAHGHAAHTTEYNDCYRRISRRYLRRVSLIHVDPAPSHFTHSTSSSSSLSSQRRRRSRTDVPGPSVSYGRVDADVRPSDVYIPSPAHMSPPPYMASSSSMYHQLMPDFALQSSEVFNSPIPQVPYFQYGNTPTSYDPGMGSGVQAEE
ncbi:hypothetical protein O6P43_001058 [Quillaja saponaria]|uniref:Uncharacterized protein n=1 Tax=Quillaja saponaria TaxID=32244 RepID=A0AAD7VNG7_QUISA|nr:hypothetical protein O6P43_001058 [Quillaja saponaria]